MIGSAPAAIFWDIDGTLLSTGGTVARTFLEAVEQVCGTRPDPRGLDFGGRLDPEIAALLVAAAGGRPGAEPAVLDRFEQLVAARAGALREHVAPLPGVTQLVAALAGAGVAQTVVTGNLESIGRWKLDAAGLVPPLDADLGGFGAAGPDRAAVARVALARLAGAGRDAAPSRCWVIGDTPRDLACARALGLRCALVATGKHSHDSLAALGADVVLSSLAEPNQLLMAWAA